MNHEENLNEDVNTESVEEEITEGPVEPPTHEEEILNAANQAPDAVRATPAKRPPKQAEDVTYFVDLGTDLQGAQVPTGVVLKSEGAMVYVPGVKITPDVNQPSPGVRTLVKV